MALTEARTPCASSSSSGSHVDDAHAERIARRRGARARPPLPGERPALRAAHAQRARGGDARRARSRRRGRLAHALRPGHLDAARAVRRRGPHDRRGARARARRPCASSAWPPTRRSSRRSSRRRRSSRTSTTRSSPTASCSTAYAATSIRASRATSTTRSRARPSTCCSPPSSATTISRIAGSGTRRSCSASTSSRSADQYAPLGASPRGRLRRRHVARRERARRLLAAHRRRGARPLPRQPHRRRAAHGQARRRVLRLDRPGRAAVHHAELHGSDGRRAHARARDRPRACSSSWPASGRPRSRTIRRWRSPRCRRRSPR